MSSQRGSEHFQDEYEDDREQGSTDVLPQVASGELSDDEDKSSGEMELLPLQRENRGSDKTKNGLPDQDYHADAEDGDGLFKDSSSHHDHPVSWRRRLDNYLYPPNVPRSCQLLRPENIAVPACYLLVGLLQGLSAPLVNVLPLDLGASEAQQTTLFNIRSLPASFKLLFGFLSDNVPIAGYRRKPYMLLGWLTASLSMLSLVTFSDLSNVTTHGAGCFGGDSGDDTKGKSPDEGDVTSEQNVEDEPAAPDGAPSIPFLALSLLVFGIGFWLADVMGDSIVAEKAKLEPPESRGSIQSSCYSFRFFGLMVAAPLSTYMYTAFGPVSVLLLLSVLPLCILPAIYLLGEVQHLEIKSTRDQCGEIWNTVCSRAAWQPMGFVFLYNLLQVTNAAWREFQRTVLHFTSCQLNLILIVTYVLLYVGILVYKYWLIRYSWRNVYIWTTLLNGLFSALQVLLIYGITFGLSSFWFALGDDVFTEFIQGIQFLPTTIMMVHLCPAGSEGASYAMFTTVNNAALTVNSAISTSLLSIWDVSKETMASGDLSGLVNLTYLTTFLQLSGVLFVGWLPHTKEGLAELASKGKSWTGGFVFLLITFLSLIYAFVVGLLNVIAPGWMGET